jgi:MFS family permease
MSAAVGAPGTESVVPTLPQRKDTSASSIDEKHAPSGDDSSVEVHKEEEGVDVVVGLFDGHAEDAALDPEVRARIRRKLDWNLLPLLFILYTLQFLDKNSIGAGSILGILQDAHLTANEYNNLGSAFYIGYIIFVYPHAWMMQRFPIAKYISVNIFMWSVFIGLQCTCHSYGGLFALRFLLGASEGCITSGIMTIISMFYTRVEISQRLGWTFQCNGIAQILSSFLAYGVAHINMKAHPRPWQWFFIIITLLSVAVSILYFWRMPDNPTNAVFLNEDDKVNVVQRIKSNQNGIESKVWKRYQFIEALKDPKTWMFFFFAAVADLQGGLGIEYAIIIKGFGFNTLQTTLLNIPSGFAMIISITLGTIALKKFPNSRTIIAALGFVPGVIGCFLLMYLPWSNKAGLLTSIYIIQFGGVGFIMMLSLCAIVFSGHTKKMTVNAIFLVGYALGQILCTQFWKVQYRPRNMVPWTIQLCTYVFDICCILFIRFYLIRENKRRDAEKAASGKEYEEFGYIEHTREDGSVQKIKVPIQFMDITDFENKAFRYAL